MIPVEICIDCSEHDAALASASAAMSGGAHRIECCCDMHVGGLTPDATLIAKITNLVGNRMEVLVMIRPRDGDFDYSETEIEEMLDSISEMASSGAHGVVFGVERDGDVPLEVLRTLTERAKSLALSVSFHRAYDAITNPHRFIEQLIEIGCDRVLSAGVPWDSNEGAISGVVGLNKTIFAARGRIELVVGGGIAAANISTILSRLSSTTALSFHAYSSVRTDGETDESRIRSLVRRLAT